MPQASSMTLGQKRSAMMHGSVHSGCIMATKLRSLRYSDSRVSRSRVMMWKTV